MAIRRFAGDTAGGFITLTSVPPDVSTDWIAGEVPAGCETLTVTRQGAQVTYTTTKFDHDNLEVDLPPGTELLVTQTVTETSEGQGEFYAATVSGHGLICVVLLATARGGGDHEMDRARLSAMVALEQWTTADVALARP